MNTRIAQDGMWLTQATIDDEAGRTFAKEVSGFGDLDALFIEWTDEQKTEWESHPHPSKYEDIPEPQALRIIMGKEL